tara:strand:- start:100 stop:1026 length:927 start_codon:yes stop_codon:yes gene_type:complete
MKNKLSIILPIYNEVQSIQKLYQEIISLKLPFIFEIIFINDGSDDGSEIEINKLIDDDSRVVIINMKDNYGKSSALSEGFKLANGEVVITMDGDLQDDPSEIEKLIEKIESGWDVVSGWKKYRKDPLSKRLLSKIFNYFTRLITGIKIHDFNCGLKAYKNKVIKSVDVYGGMHRYIPVLASFNGFKVTEIAVNHRERTFGTSKYGGKRIMKGFFDLLTVIFLGKYLNRPLHFFGKVGLLFFIMGLSINIYLTYGWFNGIWISNRPILFLGILFIILGVQFFSLGLLGELIYKINKKNNSKVDSINSNK